MLTVVSGGSGSGKSAFAEDLILKIGKTNPQIGLTNRLYLATMEPFGKEAEARIARHREMRKDKGFQTIEQPRELERLTGYKGFAILLEDLGNLAANELYGPRSETAQARILQGIAGLAADNFLVVVTNELCSDGISYPPETAAYLALLASLNRALCARADRVAEVVCGIPIFHKGGRL